jgi:hypothetical protein
MNQANWRFKAPSPKQLDYLDRYKLEVPKNRGKANDVIYEHHLKRKALTEAMKTAEKSDKKPVHMVDYSSQPDLRVRCDGSWTTPKFPQPEGLSGGVYGTADDRLYTFSEEKVTCELCIATGPNGTPMAAE